ncbi:MAG: bestrophin family ion channel [Candidatus Obscuribacterales bacterium]|nr:bestrophin family ion channel [Candidatus Obscuribacterales bacterium]
MKVAKAKVQLPDMNTFAERMEKIARAAMPKSPVFWGAMLAVFVYSLVVVYFVNFLPHMQAMEAEDITTKTSIAIGLIFAFRVNSSYDRWWEGRKLWGQLVNELRNLCIKYDLYFQSTTDEKKAFGNLVVAFAFALKNHLRDRKYDLTHAGIEVSDDKADHVPLYISQLIYKNVQKKALENQILKANASNIDSHLELLLLDSHMKALMDVCGACERIKSSPVAGWIQASIWIWMMAYFAILPWLLADQFRLWSVAIELFAAYFAIALELLAEDMQEPFGYDQNDLPTDIICLGIAKTTNQILGTETVIARFDGHLTTIR